MGSVTLAKYSDVTAVDNKIGSLTTLTSPSTNSIVNSINSINVLHYGTEILSGQDLDDYINPGTFFADALVINNINNIPETIRRSADDSSTYNDIESFKLIVSYIHPDFIKQQLFATRENSPRTGANFFRVFNGTAWSDWEQILTRNLSSGVVTPYQNFNTGLYDFGENTIHINRKINADNTSHSGGFVQQNDYLTLGQTHNYSNTDVALLDSRDSNNKRTGYASFNIDSSGDSYARFTAINSNGDYNMLDLSMAEDGTRTVTVSDAAAWRSALGVYKKPTRRAIANNTTKSCASGSNTSILAATFAPGIHIITCRASFTSNTKGRRAVFFSSSSNGGALNTAWNVNQNATEGATTVIGWTQIMDINSAATYYPTVYQNSGSTLSSSLYVSDVQISD